MIPSVNPSPKSAGTGIVALEPLISTTFPLPHLYDTNLTPLLDVPETTNFVPSPTSIVALFSTTTPSFLK